MPPIKPNNIAVANTEAIPEAVFDVFNALIAEHWDGRLAVVKLADVCDRLKGREYKHHHLNVESAYRRAGWNVKYDQPAYNETYPATFEFSKEGLSHAE